MTTAKAILDVIRRDINTSDYQKKHWEGTFEEYLDIVRQEPKVTRNAYQRLYDMILSHGTEEVYEYKEKLTRYKFFTEFATRHGDAIFGLDRPLMNLVNVFKSAAGQWCSWNCRPAHAAAARAVRCHSPWPLT